MNRELRQAVQRELGQEIRDAKPVTGGDINDAYAVTLENGQRVFIKTRPDAPPRMYPSEAEGLRWLGEADALRVPRVLACTAEDAPGPRFLVLEYLDAARRIPDFDAELGRGLGRLHRLSADGFGFDRDGFIGSLPQANDRRDQWPAFYRECRLEPMLRLARDSDRLAAPIQRRFDRLFAQLEQLVGPAEPPARLHGDLWSGNLHSDAAGLPCLIDPAAYAGHREIDLAMMRLFGGFGVRCFEAYAEVYPLAPGHAERVALYQLYPLLVHVNLFGGSYVASLERALSACV